MVTPAAFRLRWRLAPPSSHNAVVWHNPSIAVALVTCVLLVGCYRPSVLPQSEGHITTSSTQSVGGEVPPLALTSDFVPSPKPTVKQPTYSVVVDEVPVKELLFALARDTKQNIDIHPSLQGLVTINAVNETLPAILDRIAQQVDLRYRIEGNTIVITPDTAYSKTYHIDYVNMTRNTNSVIGVSGQISGTTTSQGTSGGGTQSASSTSVTTTSTNDFWKTLETTVRGILSSSEQQTRSAQNKAERLELFQKEQEIRLQEAISNKSENADSRGPAAGGTLLGSTIGSAGNQQANLSTIFPDDVIINPIAGTVTITATEMQHHLIQAYLDEVQRSVQRQVMIEATIVEVTLSDQYQAGIDWSRLAISGGLNLTQSLIGASSPITNFSPGSLTVGYTNSTSRFGNISETLKLLNQFGTTRVLSSPKLMALNNQTALLKVVDNIVYFNITAQPAILISNTVGAQQSTFTTTAQTVPVGVVMSLTPQINENGQVTLSVRPTITRVLSFVNDPNPALAAAGVTSPVPQIQTREMESVLQLVSGQTAVLGGMMQDTIQRTRNAVPGIGNIPGLSELFSSRNDSDTKSELVIFLRPTVITNPSLDSDELKSFQQFLPQQQETPTEKLPGEITGKTP
jgi:MSHA biogenesis protein MshL